MSIADFLAMYKGKYTNKEITAAFNQLSVDNRKTVLRYFTSAEKDKFISDIRTQAVKDFWTHEQSLLREGKSTRNWTPEQIEQIMNTQIKPESAASTEINPSIQTLEICQMVRVWRIIIHPWQMPHSQPKSSSIFSSNRCNIEIKRIK